MTKATLPFTFADAVKRTTARIADADLERLFGRCWRSTVDAWRNDDNPRWPRVDQALLLDRAFHDAGGDGFPMLEAYQMELNVEQKEACRVALRECLEDLSRETGQGIASSIAVLDLDASPREKRRALVDALEAKTIVDAWVRRLKSFIGSGAGPRRLKTGGIL